MSKFQNYGLAIGLISVFLSACAPAVLEDTLVGYVETEWVYISAPESGWIVSKPIAKGSLINIGDTVFELDDERQIVAIAGAQSRVDEASAQIDNISVGARPAEIRALEAQLQEARARLVHARSERVRILPLVELGVEAQSRADQVEANTQTASASVSAATEAIAVAKLAGRTAAREAAEAAKNTVQAEQDKARINLERRTVRAKTSGRVEDVFRFKGEYVTMGSPVLAVRPEGSMKVRFFVSQAKLPGLKIGTEINVRADGQPTPSRAIVSYISVEAEFTPPVIYSVNVREKLVFMVEAKLPDDTGLLAGLPVDIVLP
ncbi:MAG: secretion protein HlyD [Robiginitomaculum sp.]|nr:MAG: secretion protein HlyD [Robiginitomaculum sp.]